MNNAHFKQLQNNDNAMDTLPYSDISHIRYAENTIVTSMRLNNTFGQLVDNDKYIANTLCELSNTSIGPRYYDPDDAASVAELENGPNGYKAWQTGSSDELSIVHKVDKRIQDSVTKIQLNAQVYDFCQVAGILFIAASDGLYVCDDTFVPTKFTNVFSGTQLTSIGACYSIFADGIKTLFAADTGIYQLNSYSSYTLDSLTLCKRNKTPLHRCTTIYIRPDNQTMFVCTDDGVLTSVYTPSSSPDLEFADVVFASSSSSDSNPRVNCFSLLSQNALVTQYKDDMLALTDRGIYRMRETVRPVGYSTIFSGHEAYFTVQTTRGILVSAYDGTYLISDGIPQKIFDARAYSIAENQSAIYVGASDGMYKALTSQPAWGFSKTPIATSSPIVKICPISVSVDGAPSKLLICMDDDGYLYAYDEAQNSAMRLELPLVKASFASNNQLAIAPKSGTILSCFSTQTGIEVPSQMLEDTADQINATEYVAYVPLSGDALAVTAVSNEITLVSDPVQTISELTNVTLLKRITARDETQNEEIGYAFIDNGILHGITNQFDKKTTSIYASDIANTKHFIAYSNGDNSHLSIIQPIDIEDSVPKQTDIVVSNKTSIESDSTGMLYAVADGQLSIIRECYSTSSIKYNDGIVAIGRFNAADDDNDALIAVAHRNSIDIVQISSDDEGEDYKTATASFQTAANLNDIYLENYSNLYVASNNGLSSFYVSNDDGELTVHEQSYEFEGSQIQSYIKTSSSKQPYEFIASNAGLSARHDEFKLLSADDFTYGYSIVKNDEHEFYVVGKDDEFAEIYDKKTLALKLLDCRLHDAKFVYSRNEILLASSNGLSTVAGGVDSHGNISSIDPESLTLISDKVFYHIKTQATAHSEEGTYLATATEIYNLSDLNAPIASGFNNIMAFDGYCDGTKSILLAVDNGIIKSYDVLNAALKTYESLSATAALAVVNDDYFAADISAVNLAYAQDGDAYLMPLSTLLEDEFLFAVDADEDEDDSPIRHIGQGAVSLQKDYWLNYSLTADGDYALNRHSQVFFTLSADSEDDEQMTDGFTVFSVKQIIGNGFSRVVLDSRPIAPAFVNLTDNALNSYADAEGLKSLETVFMCIDPIECRDLELRTSMNGNELSLFAQMGNDVIAYEFNDGDPIATLSHSAIPVARGVQCYALNGDFVSLLSSNCYFPDAFELNAYTYIDGNVGSAARMFFADDSLQKAFELSQVDIIIAYADQTDVLALSDLTLKVDATSVLKDIQQIHTFNGAVYVQSSVALSSVLAGRQELVCNLDQPTTDFFIADSASKPIAFMQHASDWTYDIGGTKYHTQALNNLNPLAAFQKNELSSSLIVVIAKTGEYQISFKSIISLNLQTPTQEVDLTKSVDQIYGYAVRPNLALRLVVDNTDGTKQMWSYDPYSGTIDHDAVTSKDAAAFTNIGSVGDSLDSDYAYAYDSRTERFYLGNDILEEYPDSRMQAVNAIPHTVNKIDGYYYVCTSKGLFTSNKIERASDFVHMCNDNQFYCAISKDNKTVLLGADDGLYTLVNDGHTELSDSIFKNSTDTAPVQSLTSWNFTGISQTYAYCSNTSVLTSDNGKVYSLMLSLPNSALSINSIVPLNRHDFLFSTYDGAYRTSYEYDLVNDLTKFSESEAKDIFDAIEPTLDSDLNHKIAMHKNADHSTSSLISYLNDNFVQTTLAKANFSEWTKTSLGASQVTDDIVDKIEFGTQNDGDITLQLSNFLTSDTNAQCSYVLKRYTSGLVELYLYIPTTNTYYLNHLEGIPNCTLSSSLIGTRQPIAKFKVKPFSAHPESHYSTFDVGIAAAALSIDSIVNVEAAGNSLPLKCYKDTKNLDDDPNVSQYWHSVVEPTVLMTNPASLTQTPEGEYKLRFACFGSDAQAVKILAYDKLYGSNAVQYTVKFNANGGNGTMSPQKFIVGISQRLRKCTFTWPTNSSQSVMIGWSINAKPTTTTLINYIDNAVMLKNADEVPADGIINLYAVWVDRQPLDNGTALMIEDANGVAFVDSAKILSNSTLSGFTIIDYGDTTVKVVDTIDETHTAHKY